MRNQFVLFLTTFTMKNIAAPADSTPANCQFGIKNKATTSPASPCVGVCEINAATGYCKGCARSPSEIAAWLQADDAYKLQVLRELPKRQVR
jgi:uncharacterized protein